MINNHADAYRARVSSMDRSVCKTCQKPNDRQHEGNLGGLHCHACRNERRRIAESARRDRRAAVLASGGELLCIYCHVRGVKPGALNPSTGKPARRCETCMTGNFDREKASMRMRKIAAAMSTACARCFLRGAHECIGALQTRRSSFDNMERAT